jgi:hypothetical protein
MEERREKRKLSKNGLSGNRKFAVDIQKRAILSDEKQQCYGSNGIKGAI